MSLSLTSKADVLGGRHAGLSFEGRRERGAAPYADTFSYGVNR